jgi:signal transduction histidine kinase
LLKHLKENIDTVFTDLRNIAQSLNGNRLNSLPISETVKQEIARLDKTNVLNGLVEVEGVVRAMGKEKNTILFRMIQESLQNVIKHAQATKVAISFNYKPDVLKIAIKDNGNGFDAEKTTLYKGLGIQNIINRATLIGGAANIASAPGKGTQITITVPYAE